jgi:hypothetical protein
VVLILSALRAAVLVILISARASSTSTGGSYFGARFARDYWWFLKISPLRGFSTEYSPVLRIEFSL